MGQWIPGAHASTFGGNPLSCAAAIETLSIIEDENLLDNVSALGEYTFDRLQAFKSSHPSIQRVDGKGFMIGIDFVDPDGQPFPEFRNTVVDRCFLKGLLTLGCGKSGVRFAPPLVLTKELLDEGVDILEHSIAAVEEEMWQPAG
jgi:4-aminobutyrate aminotransferase